MVRRPARLAAPALALTLALAACSSPGGSLGDSGVEDLPASADQASSASVLCSRYIRCAVSIAPSTASELQNAYGPASPCWQQETSAKLCEQSCQAGLDQLLSSNPPSAECPHCTEDLECSGATPVCDQRRGACVACNADQDCRDAGRSVCDLSSNTCVECVAESNCSTASRPACDLSSHRCVECLSETQCASGLCYSDHTCCVPLTQCQPGMCDAASDGCSSTLSCGSCTIGTCQNNRCDTDDQPCTAATAAACGPGYGCLFERTTQAYRCASTSEEGNFCYSDGGCSVSTGYSYYRCDSTDHCRTLCLTAADCRSGQSCLVWSGTTISPSNPGICR